MYIIIKFTLTNQLKQQFFKRIALFTISINALRTEEAVNAEAVNLNQHNHRSAENLCTLIFIENYNHYLIIVKFI